MRKGIKIGKVIQGRTYDREITGLCPITSNEACTTIGIGLRHLRNHRSPPLIGPNVN